ncbi:MAG: amidohydrolase family protein [Planctomycetes bacterium]|nr:amidohydrolase family protein [Planctomycetota bacterium]
MLASTFAVGFGLGWAGALLPQEPPPAAAPPARAFAVVAETVHTMAGPPIADGVVLVRDGRIERIGKAVDVAVPDGMPVWRAAVVTPGLIDAHATVGLSGVLNVRHDQDQLERSAAVQPELRALDAYHARDPLVAWLRSFGITTVHTGHAPGALVSGQTMVVKTHGRSADQDVVVPLAMVAVTLGDGGRAGDGKAPGTRAKAVAMLREELQRAREYAAKRAADAEAPVDLGREVMAQVLRKEVPLLVTAHRAHDLQAALRVAQEFDVRVVLDGAAEAYTMLPELQRAGVAVLPHPTMARTVGELKNGTMELPRLLLEAGVPFALQSGFESYVPKSRVVLFEAGVAIGHGLPADAALRALTADAARLCGIDARTGTLVAGKDADLALWDGDPFEYTTHCLGTVIDGIEYRDGPR